MDIYNYLATAMMPLYKTMYIYGGGWNYEDTGAGRDAITYGLSQKWIAFANNATGAYDFRQYNCGENKEYSHLGLDCSAYIGWVIYNTVGKEKINNSIINKTTKNSINTKSTFNEEIPTEENGISPDFRKNTDENISRTLQKGYVFKSNTVIYRLKDLGFGEIISSWEEPGMGDICSSACNCCHHVYISLGTCADGSRVVLHSSPPGVQLSPTVDRDGRKDSMAKEIAAFYCKKYYPLWYNKYGVEVKPLSYLTHYRGFRLNLKDKMGLREKTAKELLGVLFSDKTTIVD